MRTPFLPIGACALVAVLAAGLWTRPVSAAPAPVAGAAVPAEPARPHRMGQAAPLRALPPEYADHWQRVRQAERIGDLHARCLAYPDWPGQQWPAGVAAARCALLRAPEWPLARLRAELDRPGGADAAERHYAALLDAHYAQSGQRERIYLALAQFDHSAESGELAQHWLRLAPDSGFALAALGWHHLQAGVRARGPYPTRATPPDRLQRMQAQFDLALPLLQRSQQRQPRLGMGCSARASIGAMTGSQALLGQALADCLRIDPDSSGTVAAMLAAAQPEAGGSPAQIEEALAYARARVARNPALGVLVADELYPATGSAASGEGRQALLAMARQWPAPRLLAFLSEAHAQAGEAWPSLLAGSQALRFWPEDDEQRRRRAGLALRMGLFEDAARDLQGLPQQGSEAARDRERAIAAQATARIDAAAQACEPQVAKAPASAEALACTAALAAQGPLDPVAWHLRLRALAASGERVQALQAVTRLQIALGGLSQHPAWHPVVAEMDCLRAALRPPAGTAAVAACSAQAQARPRTGTDAGAQAAPGQAAADGANGGASADTRTDKNTDADSDPDSGHRPGAASS